MELRRFRDLDADQRVRRVRQLAIGNTVAGVLVSVLAFVFLPPIVAVIVSFVMVLAVADFWRSDARYRRTGRLWG